MRKTKQKAAKRGRGNRDVNTGVPGAAPPTGGRVLRTNMEMAEWLFRNFEWPRRLAQYEAVAHAILEEHPEQPDHPRHQVARGILSLITAVKAARARREPIDWLMVTIEHKVNEANKMALLPLVERARPFDPKRRREPGPDRLDRLLDEIVRPTPTMQWKDVLSELERHADPQDPHAVIARVRDEHVWWRPRAGRRSRRLSFAGLRNRLTAIKDHLAN
jgi:hypothetical protein